jgi:hypothetical protein
MCFFSCGFRFNLNVDFRIHSVNRDEKFNDIEIYIDFLSNVNNLGWICGPVGIGVVYW